MLHSAMRHVSQRDIVLVAAGAFSAFCLLSLTSRGPQSIISWHRKEIPSKLAFMEDSGFYEDWSGDGSSEEPTDSGAEKGNSHLGIENEDNYDHDVETTPTGSSTPDSPPVPVESSVSSLPAPNTEGWPRTRVINHAAGWTMFENLYMSNGTLFIVSSPQDEQSPLGIDRGMQKPGWENGFPIRRMMTSTGEPGYATEESVRAREPTDKDMSFISTEDAERRWGDQIWEIGGNTWLSNDPNQFLGHFYHFVAETLLGFWAFYAGTLGPSMTALGETTFPPPSRAIFLRCTTTDIRDSSKFNTFYMKAAFPSITLETSPDWTDRVFMTRDGNKAWRFSQVILADRSASFRDDLVGGSTQRIAAAALSAVELQINRWWWEPIRRSVLRFANVPEELINMAITSLASFGPELAPANGMAQKKWPIVITYISRQGTRRSLTEEDHDRLVVELDALARRRGWEFQDIKAQNLAQEEQIAIAARTTIMVGVHGNGLSHLLSMAPTRLSTVIEIFNNPGFVHDYGWTARALGHHHYAIWNDTMFQYPGLPMAQVPEEFHSTSIPVYAPLISQLIEERVNAVHA